MEKGGIYMKHKIFAAIISAVIAVTSVVAPVPSFAGGTAVVAHAAQTVSAPTANYKSGTHFAANGFFTVKLKTETDGAVIYYSLNGMAFIKYTKAITLTRNSTIRAYAKYDVVKSSVVTYTYELKPRVKVKETDNSKGKLIELSSNVKNLKLYYTLDGTKPTTKSKQYTSSGIQITESCTLNVLAVRTNWASISFTRECTIEKASSSAPTASVESGTYTVTGAKMVTLSCADKNATIYYSLNGAEYKKYTQAIKITKNSTLEAYSKCDGAKSSTVTYTYKLKPKVTVTASDNSKGKLIKLSTKLNNVYLYYTLDGTRPTTKSKLYSSSGIQLTESCTLRVLAAKAGWNAAYYMNEYTIEKESSSGSTSTHNCALCKDTHICVICDGTGVHFGNVCGICHGSKICYLCAGTNPTAPNTTSYACAACLHGKCRPCSGTGKVWGWKQKITCSLCGGDGICSACHGTGIVTITY